MTDQTEFTNTPTLIQISNVEFAAKALTDAEFDELTEWIRAQVLFTARRTVKNLQLPPEETREWYQDALVVISSMTWNSKEGNRILSSVDGFAYATWLMVRESQDLHKYDQSAFVKLYKQTQYTSENQDETNRIFNRSFPEKMLDETKEPSSKNE
jgi:hypothetical protein